MRLEDVARNLVSQFTNAQAEREERFGYNRIRENLLFKELYNSYCRLKQKEGTFDMVNNYNQAANDLFLWYSARYSSAERTSGLGTTKRIRRGVTQETDSNVYAFDYPYKQATFEAYLVRNDLELRNIDSGGDPPTNTNQNRGRVNGQALNDFILHTSVAFFLSPETVDELLVHYGFQRLHVRNIHHMAIYAVLSSKEMPENPFDDVKCLYFEALKKLGSGPEQETSDGSHTSYTFPSDLTQDIHSALIESGRLSTGNMVKYVARNRDAFNMQHSLVLSDHRKFRSLYTFFYDNYGHDNVWSELQSRYSFRRFFVLFCNYSDTRERRFNERLFTWIDDRGKHPTRELMILFWLYSYCFYGDGIEVINLIWFLDELQRTLPSVESSRLENFCFSKKHFSVFDCFDVFAYVSNQPHQTSSIDFNGQEFVDMVNRKLTGYGWGVLNEKRKFDYYISSIKNIRFAIDARTGRGGYKVMVGNQAEWMEDSSIIMRAANDAGIPKSLAMIVEFYTQIKNAGEPYPLECALYEQI